MPEVAWSQSTIVSQWANAQDPESLLQFLDSKLEAGRPANQLYVHQVFFRMLIRSQEVVHGQRPADGQQRLSQSICDQLY